MISEYWTTSSRMSSSKPNLKNQFLEFYLKFEIEIKMSPDEKIEKFFNVMEKLPWIKSERYRNGINTFISDCNTIEEIEIVDHVLSNLKFCTSTDVSNATFEIAKVIQDNWKLTPEDSLIVGVAESNKTCGSIAFIRSIETSLPRTWSSKLHTNFASAFRHKKENINLVIVDDFIGTGSKLKTKIESIRNNPKTFDYNIFVITFAGMESGIDLISKMVNENIYTNISLSKCIASVVPFQKSQELLSEMLKLESTIFRTPKNQYSLGYGQSETAFYLEATNIPNNNFPILWWDEYANGSTRSTLFARR